MPNDDDDDGCCVDVTEFAEAHETRLTSTKTIAMHSPFRSGVRLVSFASRLSMNPRNLSDFGTGAMIMGTTTAMIGARPGALMELRERLIPA